MMNISRDSSSSNSVIYIKQEGPELKPIEQEIAEQQERIAQINARALKGQPVTPEELVTMQERANELSIKVDDISRQIAQQKANAEKWRVIEEIFTRSLQLVDGVRDILTNLRRNLSRNRYWLRTPGA